MRIQLDIDDDVLRSARQWPERQRQSIGAVISGLARQALEFGGSAPTSRRNGIPLLQGRVNSQPVTTDLINEIDDGAV